MAKEKLTNWAGNLSYSTVALRKAASVEQIRSFVRSQDKLKVLGTRHCFNTIADSRHTFLSMKPMHEVVALDAAARTVTVDGGITYGQLGPYLDGKGFALYNLASLPHISIAGACRLLPTVRVRRTATWQPPSPPWNSSPGQEKS